MTHQSDNDERVVGDSIDTLPRERDTISLVTGDLLIQPGRSSRSRAPTRGAASLHARERRGLIRPGQRLGNYEIVQVLGEGGMGVIYEAQDLRHSRRVALKMLFDLDVQGIYRLKREFRRMQGIRHRNLVSLYELVHAERVWFFAMELVGGNEFCEAFWHRAGWVPSQPFGPRVLRELQLATRQLTVGVHALHTAKRVHRDLKPSNVLIADDGRVVILDFGITRETVRDNGTIVTSTTGIQGTPQYMAPEQAAGQRATPESDWYAVGTILFETLTGRRPFEGQVLAVLLDKLERDPPSIRVFRNDLPLELVALIDGLQRQNPRDRPPPSELLAWCESTRRATLMRPTPVAAKPTGAPPEPLGRASQFAALRHCVDQLRKRHGPVFASLHGPSGSGKTYLAERFIATVRETASATVLRGPCYRHESLPYRGLDNIVDALSRYLRMLPDDDLRGYIDDGLETLGELFPALLRVIPKRLRAPGRALEVGERERFLRATQAFRRLLYRLALGEPLVLFFDDTQWWDRDSVRMLEMLLQPPDAPSMLVLVAIEQGHVEHSFAPGGRAFAARLEHEGIDCYEIEVGPLDTAAAVTMATQALREPVAQRRRWYAQRIARESAGNPTLIEALCQRANELPPTAPAPGERLPGVSMKALVKARLRTLPDGARATIELLATTQRPLSPHVIEFAAELRAETRAIIDVLISSRLVKLRELSEGLTALEIFNSSVADAVLSLLNDATRTRLHARMAETLRYLEINDPEWLAYHLLEAGDADAAVEHLSDAAHLSIRTLAFERAATLYGRAAGIARSSWMLKRMHADALEAAGHTAEAGAAYLEALELAPPKKRPMLRRSAAEQLLTSGAYEQGGQLLSSLFGQYNFNSRDVRTEASRMFIKRTSFLHRRGLGFAERSNVELRSGERELLDLFWVAGKGTLLAEPSLGGLFIAEGLCQALECGEVSRIDRFIAALLIVYSMRGSVLAERLVPHCEHVAREARTPYSRAIASLALGVHATQRGRWVVALDLFEDCLEDFEDRCPGSVWERSFTSFFSLSVLESQGEFREIERLCQRMSLRVTGSDELFGRLVYARFASLCASARGDLGSAEQLVQEGFQRLPSTGFAGPRLALEEQRCALMLLRGAPERAWSHLLQIWPSFERGDLFSIQAYRANATVLQSRVALATALARSRVDAHPLLTLVSANTRKLRDERLGWTTAMAEFFDASVAALQQREAAATQHLARAIREFTQVGMAAMICACRYHRARRDGSHKPLQMVCSYFAMQGVVFPERWVHLLAPYPTTTGARMTSLG